MGFWNWGSNKEIVTQDGVVIEEANSANSDGDSVEPTYRYFGNTVEGRKRIYRDCSPVRTVIGKSSNAIANLRVWALDANDVQVKSPKAKEIIAKLNRPNPKEDFKRFFRKLDVNCKLHGKAYVKKQYSTLLDEYDYYVIPNEFIFEYYGLETDELFNRKIAYFLVNDGVGSYELKPEEVHIFYDGAIDVNTDCSILGGSRLEALTETVSTYVVLWETLTGMYGDRGAFNLISMGIDDAPMLSLNSFQKERENLGTFLQKGYGGRKNQAKNAVVSTKATVNPLTARMADMEFTNTIIQCLKAIANAYDCPSVLLDIESARYKNSTEAMKILYTQSAIPTSEYYFSEWLQMIGETELNFELRADYSHLEFYQEAKMQESVAYQQMSGAVVPLYTNGILTKDEAKAKLDI
jgi:hypothetical protein